MIYKIIVDKQPYTNPSEDKKEYQVDIEELRALGDVYDSLVITQNEDYVIRRLSLSQYGILSELSHPVQETISDINIKLFKGDNYVYLADMTGNHFYAKYIIKNDFTDTYPTTVDMNSKITQTAEEIDLEVSKKVGEDEIISKINQTAEQITIDANKININGVVSANGNFEIDTEGNVSLAGNIYMTGTNTKIVGGDGLITNLQYITSGNVGLSYYNDESNRQGIACLVNIPSGFTIISANLTVKHSTIIWHEYAINSTTTNYGNSQNITCTKTTSITYERTGANVDLTIPVIPSSQGTLVATLGSFNGSQSQSVDITSSLSSGLQYLILTDYTDTASSWQDAWNKTGYMTMFVDVKGYMKI